MDRTPVTGRDARLVIVGGGFSGASLVRSLPPALRRPGETLLVDRSETYAFIPLIHEVAVGRVHPESIVSSIPGDCRGRCDFLCAEVTGVDPEKRALETSSGEVRYQYLVLNPGSVATHPPETLSGSFQPFSTLEDALRLRASLHEAWREATDRSSAAIRPGALTFAVVGGGATGVELAAEISALLYHLKRRTRRSLPTEPRVVLLEATDRLMSWLDPHFHEVAMEELARLGVEVLLETAVQEAGDGGVKVKDEWLSAQVRIWAAGVEASPLAATLPGSRDSAGRLIVSEHLTVPGYPEIYVTGDASVYKEPRHGPLPPTASVAVQQGPFVARDLERRLRGSPRRPPFRFFNRGYVVSLGPESAVGEALGLRLRGPVAQALYRSVLLYYMDHRGRALTGSDWAMERPLGRVGFDS